MLDSQSQTAAERLTVGFELAVSREPDDHELATLERLLSEEQLYYASHPAAAKALIDSADRGVDVTPAGSGELAAWTSVARAMVNLHETVTRN